MITIVVGTNRKNSKSELLARVYERLLNDRGVQCQVFELNALPECIIKDDMYENRNPDLMELAEKYIRSVEKIIFVIPEYQGSFPGVLKLFMDSIPPDYFPGKKAGLIGLAAGRAGNLRGTDQFTGVLNYLKINVFYSKPKLSEVYRLFDQDGNIADEKTLGVVVQHLEEFLEF